MGSGWHKAGMKKSVPMKLLFSYKETAQDTAEEIRQPHVWQRERKIMDEFLLRMTDPHRRVGTKMNTHYRHEKAAQVPPDGF